MQNLSFVSVSGTDIEPYLTELGLLRLQVFRDFPYLYEGDLDYERAYLDVYLRTPASFLFAVFADGKMVGATTALPLAAETPDVQQPFLDAEYKLDEICYFGESILLPQYRGVGLGHRFFDEREAYALGVLKARVTCFCAVNRPENHALKPVSYRPNDAFWLKRGYAPQPELVCEMQWKDRDCTQETTKSLTFWTKEWP
jgi:GNAT superfamily N-acetyltransferase